MLTHCPHCQQALQLTAEQAARIEQALTRLEPGKTLTLKCPRCRGAITLDKPAPAARPANPRFSSGPCAKIPQYSLDMLADAPLG